MQTINVTPEEYTIIRHALFVASLEHDSVAGGARATFGENEQCSRAQALMYAVVEGGTIGDHSMSMSDDERSIIVDALYVAAQGAHTAARAHEHKFGGERRAAAAAAYERFVTEEAPEVPVRGM